MANSEQKIIDIAERMIREGGYNAFSFREIAKEIGIKSSSVHYYFPTKEDLGAKVAECYTQKFLNALGNVEALISENEKPTKHYIQTFKRAFVEDKRMCLCGLLGAEINALPEKVAEQTKLFFSENIKWLEKAYTLQKEENPKQKATRLLASLEGAMIMALVTNHEDVFNSLLSEE